MELGWRLDVRNRGDQRQSHFTSLSVPIVFTSLSLERHSEFGLDRFGFGPSPTGFLKI